MHNQRASAATAALALISLLSSCGTIVRGTNEDVSVQTSPAGAVVTTDIGLSCIGPCILKVPRKKSFVATANAPGYLPASASVGTQVSGGGTAGLAGNIVFGGIIGGAIDVGSGAMKDHFPNPVVLALTPIDPNAPPPAIVAPPPQVGPVISMADPAKKPVHPQALRYPNVR